MFVEIREKSENRTTINWQVNLDRRIKLLALDDIAFLMLFRVVV